MKECDFFGGGGVKTYSDPPTYFQGVRTPNPHDLRPGLNDIDILVLYWSSCMVWAV